MENQKLKYRVTYTEKGEVTRVAEFKRVVNACATFIEWSHGMEEHEENDRMTATRGDVVVIIEEIKEV
jgi:hypothetical protein